MKAKRGGVRTPDGGASAAQCTEETQHRKADRAPPFASRHVSNGCLRRNYAKLLIVKNIFKYFIHYVVATMYLGICNMISPAGYVTPHVKHQVCTGGRIEQQETAPLPQQHS